MQGFIAGNETAFRQVYQQYYQPLLRFARRWVNDAAEAEDITAAGFVKLWHHRSRFDNLEHIRCFLHTAIRNDCINYLKSVQVKTARQRELQIKLSADTSADFAIDEIRQELMQLIYAEVEQLPKKMREIFLLSYAEGLKPAEIAEKLGLSVQTVSNQKTNAIRLLRVALGGANFCLFLLICLAPGRG